MFFLLDEKGLAEQRERLAKKVSESKVRPKESDRSLVAQSISDRWTSGMQAPGEEQTNVIVESMIPESPRSDARLGSKVLLPGLVSPATLPIVEETSPYVILTTPSFPDEELIERVANASDMSDFDALGASLDFALNSAERLTSRNSMNGAPF